MRSIIRHGQEHGDYVGLVVAVVVVVVREGWIGIVALGPIAVLLFVLDRRHVEDDVLCAKCSHRKDEHHGNCQECLREQLRGELRRDVPCSRFGRGSDPVVPAVGSRP